MKVLLTGALGFIGSKILKELTKYDVRITALVRENKKYSNQINDERINYIYIDDLFNKDLKWWLGILKDIDCVIHSAWYTENSKYLHSKKNLECLKGSLNLIEACSISKIKFFVGIGTCFEYDFNYTNKKLTTSTPLNPKSPYTLAKVSLLNSLKLLQITSDFQFAWCRIFYVYGEGDDPRRLIPYIHDMLNKSQKAYIKNGDLIRDYIDVKEAGKLIAKIALNCSNGEFNICTGEGKMIRDLALEIGKFHKKPDLIFFEDSNKNKTSPAKIIGDPN